VTLNELTDEVIDLMCVQTRYFSGRAYRSRIEIIVMTYGSVFRRIRKARTTNVR